MRECTCADCLIAAERQSRDIQQEKAVMFPMRYGTTGRVELLLRAARVHTILTPSDLSSSVVPVSPNLSESKKMNSTNPTSHLKIGDSVFLERFPSDRASDGKPLSGYDGGERVVTGIGAFSIEAAKLGGAYELHSARTYNLVGDDRWNVAGVSSGQQNHDVVKAALIRVQDECRDVKAGRRKSSWIDGVYDKAMATADRVLRALDNGNSRPTVDTYGQSIAGRMTTEASVTNGASDAFTFSQVQNKPGIYQSRQNANELLVVAEPTAKMASFHGVGRRHLVMIYDKRDGGTFRGVSGADATDAWVPVNKKVHLTFENKLAA